MPQGQFTAADLQQPAHIGQFSAADLDAQPAAAPSKPSFWDRFKDQPQDAAYDDTLKREVKAAGGAISGIPSAIYHAFSEPPTPEERAEFNGDVDGAKRIGLGIHRLTTAPLEVAAKWYGDVAQGKVPNAYEQALSVAPEAVGSAGGTVLAGKMIQEAPGAISKGAQVVKSLPDAIRPGAIVEAARNITPKQAAQVAGGVSGGVAGHGTLSAPGAYYGAKSAGALAESVLGKERANAPIFPKPEELDLTGANKDYAGERTPPPTPPPAGTEPPAPRIPDKYKPPIPGVNVPPNISRIPAEAIPGVDTPPSVGRIQEPAARPIPSEPPAPANPDYVPIRPSIERIIDEVKSEPAYKDVPRAELDAKFSKILQEVQQEHAQPAPEAPPAEQDLTPALMEHLRQLRMRQANPVAQAPRESLAEFNARLAKIADARKAAQ